MSDAHARTDERIVVSGGFPTTRVVPSLTVDDVTRDLGDREYAAMLRDPVVAANDNLYRAAIVSDDPQIIPAITDKTANGYALAAELATWIGAQLEDIETPIIDSLSAMLDALSYGCKIAEVVLRQETAYTGRTQLVLAAIKPKPRTAAALGVDQFLNVRSIYAQTPDGMRELLKDGFLIYTFRPKDADPRGTSLLRPAHVPWDLKMKTWHEYYKYLVRFASPSLWATVPAGAPDEQLDDGTVVDAVTSLLINLQRFQNGSVLVGQSGLEVHAITSGGEGTAFLNAFELYNREITTAMLTAVRAVLEAQHGSRADSETASNVVSTFIRQTRLSLERSVRRSVFQWLVVQNYGAAAVRFTPYLSLGGVAQEDVGALMAAVARLQSVKYFDPSQLPELDARMGLATRTPEELTARTISPPEPAPIPPDGGTHDNPATNPPA